MFFGRRMAAVQARQGAGRSKLHGRIRGSRDSADTLLTHPTSLTTVLLLRRFARLGPLPWYERSASSHLHVAVHIRRGDLSSWPHWAALGRWVPDSYYERVLPQLAVLCAKRGAPTTFHIMSEDADMWRRELQPRWSALLAAAGVQTAWHLDKGLLLTMAHLIEADILVACESDFSLTAATFNLGLATHSDLPIKGRAVLSLPSPPRCTCLKPSLAQYTAYTYYLNSHDGAITRQRFGDAMTRWWAGHFTAQGCWLLCDSSIPPSGENRSVDGGTTSCEIASLLRWKATQHSNERSGNAALRWSSIGTLLLAGANEGTQCDRDILRASRCDDNSREPA